MSEKRPVIAVVGGTGALGGGLAWRWARAGFPVIIGSRDAERAAEAARDLAARVPGAQVSGRENADAAAVAEVCVLTVPYGNHRPMLEAVKAAVQGKIVVDATVPLVPPKVSRVQLPAAGSAAKEAQDFLGEGVRVVAAMHNIAAAHLAEDHAAPECDVLVCGNDDGARATVVALVEAAGFKAWHAGPIENAAAAEALTSVLIFINRRYKIEGAGIRITGAPQA